MLLRNQVLFFIITACLLFISNTASSQDSTEEEESRSKIFFNNIFKQAKDALTVNSKDSAASSNVLSGRSELEYSRYNKRIIRHITFKQLGFEKSFEDTSSRIKYFGTRILNRLHRDSRSWVIRANLYFYENTELNPHLLADNERYLRSLNFIQDARIKVKPIRGRRDSVDIEVTTKDLFSITGSLDVDGLQRVRVRARENNLMGLGQGLQYTALLDKNRSPVYGYEIEYTKNSIANTFINGTIGYTLINTGRSMAQKRKDQLT